jgi:pyruvate,orthophosphate dikinase
VTTLTRRSGATGTAGKLERIAQLAAKGLNTPRLLLIEAKTKWDDDLRDELRAAAHGAELMTVRTYHPTDEITYAKGPFHPEIPVDEAIALAENLSADWNVLFQEAIDVDETEIAGNVVVSADGSGAYEALKGRYRVRDVEYPSEEARSSLEVGDFQSPDNIADDRIKALVRRIGHSGILDDLVRSGVSAAIFEFNVQTRPVGREDERLLFWEWRPAIRAGRRRDGRVFGVGVDGLEVPSRAEGPRELGGKAANLATLAGAGLPVPPFVVLSAIEGSVPTDVPPVWEGELHAALEALRSVVARQLPGHETIAVRSSPSVSMPGMLETVLDVAPDALSVRTALRDVLRSWHSERASAYRAAHGIEDDSGLAVLLQPLIDTTDVTSGAGVGFTRDPVAGASKTIVEFVRQRSGEALVGGTATPLSTDEFARLDARAYNEVLEWIPRMEQTLADALEFEFAVERGRAFLLQARPLKRTASAGARIALDLAEAGIRQIPPPAAAAATNVPAFDTGGLAPIAIARVASPGVARGRIALTGATVASLAQRGEPAILVREVASPDDYPLIQALAGFISRHGGVTSHAAVVALEARVPALVGCEALRIELEEGAAWFGDTRLSEEDWVSFEATADGGRVFGGQLQ